MAVFLGVSTVFLSVLCRKFRVQGSGALPRAGCFELPSRVDFSETVGVGGVPADWDLILGVLAQGLQVYRKRI